MAFYWTRRHFDPHPTRDMAKKSKRKQRREAPDPFPDDLLGPLMRTLPDVFEAEVLSKLTWLDAYKIACVNHECRETMEDIEAVLFMRTEPNVKTLITGPHHGLPDDFHIDDDEHQEVVGGIITQCAAADGELDILKWLRKHKCPWDEYTLVYAGDHLDVMQWAIENGCPMNAIVSHPPAETGHEWEPEGYEDNSLDTLKFLHNHGCPFDTGTCSKAVISGKLEKLVWLRSPPINCPWDAGTTQTALYYCRWDMLKFALDNGCPYHPADRRTISTVASRMTARIEKNSTKSED